MALQESGSGVSVLVSPGPLCAQPFFQLDDSGGHSGLIGATPGQLPPLQLPPRWAHDQLEQTIRQNGWSAAVATHRGPDADRRLRGDGDRRRGDLLVDSPGLSVDSARAATRAVVQLAAVAAILTAALRNLGGRQWACSR